MLTVRFLEDQNHFAPGDILRGTAEWNLMEEAGDVSVHLFWHTEGKGTKDAEVIDTETYQHSGRSGRRDFQFTLPMSPYTYRGTLVSIIWEVELVVDGVDEIAHQTFTLGPRQSLTIEGEKGWKPKELF